MTAPIPDDAKGAWADRLPRWLREPAVATLSSLVVLLLVIVAALTPVGDPPIDPPPSTTSTTAAPTTTTESPPSTTTVPNPPPTTIPPTTVPSTTGPFDDVPSNFDVDDFLSSRPPTGDTSWEPSGNFRTFCQPSHLAWDDPIVYPGQTDASHLHQFFGNLDVDHDATYESLRTTGDSTCEGGPLNRTGYWTPAVFDGQDRVVVPSFILVYYKGGANGGTSLAAKQDDIRDIEPFPNGLRMISDNGSWRCENSSNYSSTIPDGCPGTVIAEVHFPFCWDGENLDSPDHRSHMSFKVRNNHTGQTECPDTHPVHLPELTEIFYYPNGGDAADWYLSSDVAGMLEAAPDGSTLHADWFGAWDNTIQDRWVNNCIGGMRNANNGDLCDGEGLAGGAPGMSTQRLSGWTPLAP